MCDDALKAAAGSNKGHALYCVCRSSACLRSVSVNPSLSSREASKVGSIPRPPSLFAPRAAAGGGGLLLCSSKWAPSNAQQFERGIRCAPPRAAHTILASHATGALILMEPVPPKSMLSRPAGASHVEWTTSDAPRSIQGQLHHSFIQTAPNAPPSSISIMPSSLTKTPTRQQSTRTTGNEGQRHHRHRRCHGRWLPRLAAHEPQRQPQRQQRHQP